MSTLTKRERTLMNDYIVETHGLTKRFGSRVAVDGIDLRIPRGSAFGYLGPNGAGKTTLIRMLLGLTRASEGSMRLLGRPVPAERAKALARVGAIVEEPRFHAFLTGRENLEIVAAARGPEAFDRIDGVLDRVGLAARAGERVKKYSLGMRQRLGVARALLGDPELLILDEPTNGLDPAGILEFRRLTRRLVGEGRTVVLSSHLLDEVEKICDAVAIVDQGRVVWQGPIDAIRNGGRRTLHLVVDDEAAAVAVLAPRSVETTPDGLLVTVPTDADAALAAEINRQLVAAGIAVQRLELSQASLEERFLEITSRLEEAA
jgi:ABC-2 type transport system ATP-binding protein